MAPNAARRPGSKSEPGTFRMAPKLAPERRASARTSRPSNQTFVTQEKWFNPTYSSSTFAPGGARAAMSALMLIGTLQRPTTRSRPSPLTRASATRPEGLAKLTNQAPGASSVVRCAIPATTGIDLSAFASPPSPVVSCPMKPCRRGMRSSRARASSPPTRIWHTMKSASRNASSRSVPRESLAREPAASSILPASPPTIPSFPWSMSMSLSSASGRIPSRLMKPSTSSGV